MQGVKVKKYGKDDDDDDDEEGWHGEARVPSNTEEPVAAQPNTPRTLEEVGAMSMEDRHAVLARVVERIPDTTSPAHRIEC